MGSGASINKLLDPPMGKLSTTKRVNKHTLFLTLNKLLDTPMGKLSTTKRVSKYTFFLTLNKLLDLPMGKLSASPFPVHFTGLVFENLDFKNGTRLKVVFLEPAHQ